MKRLLVIGLILTLMPQLSACGSTEDTGSTPGEAAGPVEMAYTGGWPGLKRVAGRYADRLVIPHGPAPRQVVVKDLKVGGGPVIQDGDLFYAKYVTFGYETGKAVERYWRAPSFYTAGLGTYKKGWEVGTKGIRVGGVRELIVPSRMAYKNGALVYVLQVVRLG